jgi:hypothetical protein
VTVEVAHVYATGKSKIFPSGNSDRRSSHAYSRATLWFGATPLPQRDFETWQSFQLCASYVEEVTPIFATDGKPKTISFTAQNFGQGTFGTVCGFEPRLSCESFTWRSIRSLHHWPIMLARGIGVSVPVQTNQRYARSK